MTEISLFDDGLDEEDLATLSASQDLTIEANRNLGNVVADVIKDSGAISKTQQLFEQNALTDIDRIYGDVLRTQDRLINIEDNPAFVNNIMSLLGHEEFNKRVQGAKLKRSQFELQRLDSKISRSQSITASRQAASKQRILGAQTQANIAATESGILVEQFKLGMNFEQFKTAQKRFDIFVQQNEVVQTQQQVASLGKKQLEAELGKDESKLPRGLMEDRLRQIETAEVALEAAQVTMAAGKSTAARKSIEAFLANAGTPFLQKLLSEIVESSDRTARRGNIIFQEGQIVTALNKSMLQDTALLEKTEEVASAMAEANAGLIAIKIQTQKLDNAFNGSMPVDGQAKLIAASDLLVQAKDQNEIQPGSVSPLTVKARLDQANVAIEELTKAFATSFTEPISQEAATAFTKDALTPRLAAGFLGNEIFSPAAIASGNIIFDTMGTIFLDRMSEIQAEEEQKNTVFQDPATGITGIASRSRERDAARQTQLAMEIVDENDNDFATIASVLISDKYFTDVLAAMTVNLDATDPKIMANIINPETKRFNLELTKSTGQPNKELVFAALAQNTGTLRSQGVLKPDESLTKLLVDLMKDPQNLTKFVNENFSDLNIHQESFMQILYRGTPLVPLNNAINEVLAFAQKANRVENVSEASQDVRNVRGGIPPLGMETTTGAFNQPGGIAAELERNALRGTKTDEVLDAFRKLVQ